jgi:hypothetical protein
MVIDEYDQRIGISCIHVDDLQGLGTDRNNYLTRLEELYLKNQMGQHRKVWGS